MEIERIIKHVCYTDLVYNRINKKLGTNLTNYEIESLISQTLNETDDNGIFKRGKNYYITNKKRNMIVTINSRTFRVITVNIVDQVK